MPASRAEQQLKAKLVRTCNVLSGFLKQLRSGATLQAKLGAISDSLTTCETVFQSMHGASSSCMQLYLDSPIPTKVWEQAVCMLQLLNTEGAPMQDAASKGFQWFLVAMLRFTSLLPKGLRAAAWQKLLPVAEDGKQGTQPQCFHEVTT